MLFFRRSIIPAMCAIAFVLQSLQAAEPARRFIAADSSRGRVAIIGEDGKTEWDYKIGPLHDLHVLPNGHVLLQTSWTDVAEVNPANNEIVWRYDAKSRPENKDKALEIHAFQRLANGTTMVAESGPGNVVEIGADLKLVHSMSLQVTKPDAHRDTRLVRKLTSGTYLVCHEGDGLVREYDPSGKTVWEYAVPLFDRKPAGGHGVEAFGNQCSRPFVCRVATL